MAWSDTSARVAATDPPRICQSRVESPDNERTGRRSRRPISTTSWAENWREEPRSAEFTDVLEDEAYSLETATIAPLLVGQLWNQKSGGFEGAVLGPEGRRKISEANKRRYQDPAQRAQASLIAKVKANSPEARAKRSQTNKRRFAAGEMPWLHESSHRPEVYKKRGDTLRRTIASSPEIADRLVRQLNDHWSDPKKNAAHRAALAAAHARPDVKAKRRAYYDSPEGRANLRRALEIARRKRQEQKARAAA